MVQNKFHSLTGVPHCGRITQVRFTKINAARKVA